MNSKQLLDILELDFNVSQIVKGVYSSNNLPVTVFNFPSAYVINTKPSYTRGEHWVCAWFDGNKNVDFFDSFGRNPIQFDNRIVIFLHNNSTSVQYNNFVLQDQNSDVCGYYVLVYLTLKSRGYCMSDIVSFFGHDKQINDRFVVNFVNRNFAV